MKRRSGSMLIEMCGVIAGGSAVMLLGIGLIERSFHMASEVQLLSNQQRELGRLAEFWRSDFSGVPTISTVSPDRLVIATHGGEVSYTIAQGGVIREENRKRGLDGAEGNVKSVEKFELGKSHLVTFQGEALRVNTVNSAGEITGLRLRVIGKSPVLEDKVQTDAN